MGFGTSELGGHREASNCLHFWRGYPTSEVFSGVFQSTVGKYSYLRSEEV